MKFRKALKFHRYALALGVSLAASSLYGAQALAADEAQWTHVRPVRLDVREAGLARVLAERDSPALGDRRERRPERELTLIVDERVEAPVVVVEGVRHGKPPA